jgi:glycerol kinase
MDLLMQIQADQLQVPVARPVVPETTALGAAYLAGLGEGVWESPKEIADLWAEDAKWQPASSQPAADRLYESWLRAVERSRGWAATQA